MAELVGVSIGPYQILEKLGEGGMGEVFLGHDPRLQRRVALKCLTGEAQSGDLHARVLREARAAARLNHPHIAAVYDVLEREHRTFIVMEYVEGISLAAHLTAGPLPAAEVRAIGRQIASALAAAHAQGVVHRDLKPANIHLAGDGSIKILDFGVAKLTALVPDATDTTMGGIHAESTVPGNPGTPAFMSPEQLLNRPVDAHSDIYSTGVILFLMATGRRPYLENNVIALAVAINSAPAPEARAVNPLVPFDLSAAIGKALEREPERRFQSARALEAALTAATRIAAAPDDRTRSAVPAKRRRAWIAAAAATVLLAAGVTSARAPILTRLGLRPAAATAPGRATVLAILPVDNPSGDAQADSFGAGIASVVAENFSSIPGLTVLSRASTAAYAQKRNDLQALSKDLGADYVLDLSVRAALPQPQVLARFRGTAAAAPIWERTLTGGALVVETAVLEDLGRQLEAHGALSRRLTRDDWSNITRLPTSNAQALDLYSQARTLLNRPGVPGNGTRAAALLERAVALDPSFALAYAALGDAFWDAYQADKDPAMVARATDAIMAAIRLAPDRAAVYYSLGNMQHLTGRPEDAAASLRRAIALQPDSDESHRLLGEVLAERGDVDAAVAELQQAIRIRPRYWRSYMTLGLVYYRSGRYREALEPYRRATDLQPNEPSPFANLGTVYHRLGDITQAIGNYEHAVRLGPSASAYANLALAYYRANRLDDARNAYEQSLIANPKSVLNHRNLGDVLKRLGQTTQARAQYEQAIAIGAELVRVNPRDVRTIALMALCEAKLGRSAGAERHAAEARALAPEDREILQRSAEVHALLGSAAVALQDLGAAIAHGYSRQDARENDELAPLRKLPAFAALVADRP